MKKRILSLMLVASMAVFTLVGCGDAASSSSSSDSAPASTEASGDAWHIGGIGPITGGAAQYGQGVMNAIQIAVDEINAAGGIKGAQIAYNFQDDEHDATKSVNAYNTLKDWGMQVLVGTVTSSPCIAVSAEAYNDRMFLLTPSASSTDVTADKDNAYQVCFTDPAQGTLSADYISANGLATKVGVIYDSSDPYSSGIYNTFAAEAAVKGLEIVAAEAFTADSKTDFTTQLQKCQDAGAELLFMPFYYTEASIVLTQANQMGFAPIFFGVDGMDGILSVENFDVSLAEGVYLLTPFAADAKDDLTVNFVTTYESKYGETPNQFAADAYDCVYAIKAALETTDLTPAASSQEICEALIAAMQTISYDGLTGSNMTWGANGEVSKDPKAVIITNGAYVSAQ